MWVVLKFGGTSVANGACWETIVDIVKERVDEGLRPLVVCSACAGVSDEIERLLDEAIHGGQDGALARLMEIHRTLADDMGVGFEQVSASLDELERIVTGIALTREVTPRLRAKAMAFGEIMSTRLGAAYLTKRGIDVAWHDARDYLKAVRSTAQSTQRSYLHATCAADPDEDVQRRLSGEPRRVIITQGFIATDDMGDTVLLGRGGSDVSAAYFAVKLGARHCEIWTDVPGMFTANPRQVPTARLLRTLDYDEAQEIASTGAKILHPRCVAPLGRAGIPLKIRCVSKPHLEGTVISLDARRTGAQVKAISSKRGITLLSMETMDMWHQAGYLADVFGCFKRHGFSIDLVSTSEANVTVTLDRAINVYDESTMGALIADLKEFCQVRVIEAGAMVSLVGRDIRGIFHELGPALEVFEEHKIHLVTQASNDLNLSFVVDEEQADRLVRDLHGQIFDQRIRDQLLGPTWRELFDKGEDTRRERRRPWWQTKRAALLDLATRKSPLYVYDRATIGASIDKLKKLEAVDRLFYSIKANAHPEVLRTVHDAGLGFECVSANEVKHVLAHFPAIDPQRILFTPNFVPQDEYRYALNKGAYVTLDNLFCLERWPDLFRGREILVRMDPGRGQGHHKYVHTAGTASKFGVHSFQLDQLEKLTRACGAKVIGLHAHVGSNIFTPTTWSEAAQYLAQAAERFPDVRILDMGGGFGVVEKPGQGELDLHAVDEHLRKVKEVRPCTELWIEPGRFIVAEAGVLLARVTQTKQKGECHYVGIDAGMNTLIRPALYGAYQEIVNLTRLDEEPSLTAHIVGPICESGDILGYARSIASPQEGDVILIATVGAYGRAMSSWYNLREPAAEHML